MEFVLDIGPSRLEGLDGGWFGSMRRWKGDCCCVCHCQ